MIFCICDSGGLYMNTLIRRSILFTIDIILLTLAYFITFELRFEFYVPLSYVELLKNTFILIVLIKILFYFVFGLYNSLWRYVSVDELFKLILATTISSILIYIFNLYMICIADYHYYSKLILKSN